MVMFKFFKLWFVLFYIYNHDVTFTLYINWTVFFYINICSFIAIESNLELNKIEQ